MDTPLQQKAGIISRIKLENFMCHSSLQIEFGDWVNFITGQNGSGKSAILTALCVAFGCRARGTQRASSLKDFIKTGCNYALVVVEIKNLGEDAFKPEVYGGSIILERRITESTSSIVLKDRQGRKVAQRRDELQELVEHFNIDVENPCVIMTQDKSREFLHSGNDKDKFKFFFKATLLQQVSELLQNIKNQLELAHATVNELESSIKPIVKELKELSEKIKNMEHVEEISHELQILKKKLAWSWVYHVDRETKDHNTKLEKLKERVPVCQVRIDKYLARIEELQNLLVNKKAHVKSLMEKTSEVRRMKDELQQNLSVATKERFELEEEYARANEVIAKMNKRVRWLEQQTHNIRDEQLKETQAEEFEIEEQMRILQGEIDEANTSIRRLQDEENDITESMTATRNALREIDREVEVHEKKARELRSYIRDLQQSQTNKVTAFGGEKVLYLLQIIERRHRQFKTPPIGPLGAHVSLVNGDIWALAVECAVGKLLDSFIATNHKDSLVLRDCAKEAKYYNLNIIIYDFSRPRLNIPNHFLPTTNHPTILSVLHSDNPTVMNVLVDMGSAERQVLVKDYNMGKTVAFEQRIQNMKEVYTSDGYKMFSRGNVQTTLPPNRRTRAGRLCSSIDDQIVNIEKEVSVEYELIQQSRGKKRSAQDELRDLEGSLHEIKRQRTALGRYRTEKNLALRDLKNAYDREKRTENTSNADELYTEISQIQEDVQKKELVRQKIHVKKSIAEKNADELKKSFESLCNSAKGDIDAIEEAERELLVTEEELQAAERERVHYEGVMNNKVLPDIKAAEAYLEELRRKRQSIVYERANQNKENFDKASVICLESEVDALGGCGNDTAETFSAKINRLKQRLQREAQRFDESIDDYRMMYEKKQRKILRRQRTYADFRNKLNACQEALDKRWSKFQRNASHLKRQLTWQFNGHLKKKGNSGQIKVDYDKKVLSVEVKMSHDASGNTVRDTRGLSGGERSFSTLCFAMALHEMTEAPFRAMDEFDVFMDAVSRKISLDTLGDFAVAQGSQWIFITPHDISMVKAGDKVRKQQMAAPRG